MDIENLYQLFLKNPTITTDSRNCPRESIFFALKGNSFNGNTFAKETLKKGCSYAIVDEQKYADDDRIIYVENCLKALQELAKHHRETLRTPVIGITGTNGKTTTKELVASVLKQKYNVLYTQGNLNNHIGVPLTLLQLKKKHDIAIVEMGANHPGEIKTLVEIARPDYGIITNVGKAHIEGFGSFEGVIRTKCELYDFLSRNNGCAFVNQSNEILLNKAKEKGLTIQPYGSEPPVCAKVLSFNPFLTIEWEGKPIETKLIGQYNFENILAAIAVGRKFHVDDDSIRTALASYTPTNNRSQFAKTKDNQLIVDAYNANPTSMNASLDNFLQIRNPQKSVILGDMKELGAISKEEHQKVADKLNQASLSNIFLVGENFKKTECPKATKFDNVTKLKEYLADNPLKGQLVLIKGSNSMKLVDCIESL